MLKSQDIDYIAEQAYEAGFEGRDSEELPKRLSDQLETGFEYVWLDNYREGENDARDLWATEQVWFEEECMLHGHPNWD
ncbi:MAG: hypothetical protein ACR2ON_00600 [Paracoccaceae bacterium]